MTRALWRYGGMLVQPRRTARAFQIDEGAHDGAWLVVLYLGAVGTFEFVRAIATVLATSDLNGFLMLAAALGRSLVVPIVVLTACEAILGSIRSYRRGLMLVPLLFIVGVAQELRRHGIPMPLMGPEIVGCGASIAMCAWVRTSITPEKAP